MVAIGIHVRKVPSTCLAEEKIGVQVVHRIQPVEAVINWEKLEKEESAENWISVSTLPVADGTRQYIGPTKLTAASRSNTVQLLN